MANSVIFQEHTLDRPGCRLHYWLAGPVDRPLAVFTHGASVDHHEFHDLLALIAAEYRVLAWDVRGHGLSRPAGAFTIRACVDDLLALLDDAGAVAVIIREATDEQAAGLACHRP